MDLADKGLRVFMLCAAVVLLTSIIVKFLIFVDVFIPFLDVIGVKVLMQSPAFPQALNEIHMATFIVFLISGLGRFALVMFLSKK